MLSDDRVQLALQFLQRPIAEFRATVEGALAQAEGFLAAHESDPLARAERLRHELGPFASTHIDADGFAALFARPAGPALSHQDRFRTAVDTLRDVLERGVGLFVVQVPPGGSLTRTVDDALSRVGRAFGAVLAVELMRGGAFRPEEHDALLMWFAFRSWTRTERRFAPPLVVQVSGADLHVAGLADFSDGRERIVLIVEGQCPPAALVRLITPGMMVLQTSDATGLEQLALHDGPGIAAMVPSTAAHFLHDPRAGREPWQRLSVWHMPDPPKHSVGGFSPWQMAEDLHQLAALACAPTETALPSIAVAVAPGSDAVERLASWLLTQSDLRGMT
jgi:hypothetical protein